MKDKIVFKSQLKPLLWAEIKKHRDNGGTFSEIARLMNSKKQYTLHGKPWTENYIYRFLTENNFENRKTR